MEMMTIEEIGNYHLNNMPEPHRSVYIHAPAMFNVLKMLVDCPDYRGINTHEMKAARAIIANIEGK